MRIRVSDRAVVSACSRARFCAGLQRTAACKCALSSPTLERKPSLQFDGTTSQGSTGASKVRVFDVCVKHPKLKWNQIELIKHIECVSTDL